MPRAELRIWRCDLIVADGFVLTELAAIVDVLRIANRVQAQPQFEWTVRSPTGGRVSSSAGLFADTRPLALKPEADFAIIGGNLDGALSGLPLRRVMDAYTSRGCKVYLLAEAAGRYIREKGETGLPMTAHWENSELLREGAGLGNLSHALACEDGWL